MPFTTFTRRFLRLTHATSIFLHRPRHRSHQPIGSTVKIGTLCALCRYYTVNMSDTPSLSPVCSIAILTPSLKTPRYIKLYLYHHRAIVRRLSFLQPRDPAFSPSLRRKVDALIESHHIQRCAQHLSLVLPTTTKSIAIVPSSATPSMCLVSNSSIQSAFGPADRQARPSTQCRPS